MHSKNSIIFFIIFFSPYILGILFTISSINFPTEFTSYIILLLFVFLLSLSKGSFKVFYSLHGIGLIFVITTAVTLYTLFSPSSYSIEKFMIFAYLVLAKILASYFLDLRQIYINERMFLTQLNQYSIIMLLFLFVLYLLGATQNFDNATSRRFVVGFENPIWFSRVVVNLSFIMIFSAFMKRKLSLMQLISLGCAVALLIGSGSRGPALSLILATLLLTFFNIKQNKFLYIIVGSFAFIPITVLATIELAEFNIYSLLARLEYARTSMQLFEDNFFGYGFGSFGLVAAGKDAQVYPHNFFLEIAVELGVISLILVAFYIRKGVLTIHQSNIFSFLFFIALINAQFSGDLNSNASLFVFLVLGIRYKNVTEKIRLMEGSQRTKEQSSFFHK